MRILWVEINCLTKAVVQIENKIYIKSLVHYILLHLQFIVNLLYMYDVKYCIFVLKTYNLWTMIRIYIDNESNIW